MTSSVTKESLYSATVLKGAKDPESGKFKQWLEIYDKTTKIKSIDVDSIEEHSTIMIDPQFANFLWSPNGKQLLYTAEFKPPKAISYFKNQPKKSDNNEADGRGQEYILRYCFAVRVKSLKPGAPHREYLASGNTCSNIISS